MNLFNKIAIAMVFVAGQLSAMEAGAAQQATTQDATQVVVTETAAQPNRLQRAKDWVVNHPKTVAGAVTTVAVVPPAVYFGGKPTAKFVKNTVAPQADKAYKAVVKAISNHKVASGLTGAAAVVALATWLYKKYGWDAAQVKWFVYRYMKSALAATAATSAVVGHKYGNDVVSMVPTAEAMKAAIKSASDKVASFGQYLWANKGKANPMPLIYAAANYAKAHKVKTGVAAAGTVAGVTGAVVAYKKGYISRDAAKVAGSKVADAARWAWNKVPSFRKAPVAATTEAPKADAEAAATTATTEATTAQ